MLEGMGQLTGKAAIVTGAARGIGRAIAERLAAGGARVAVNYANSAAAAEELAFRTGGLAIRADVSQEQEVREMFDRAEAEFGGLDIVVNNAAVALMKPLAEFSAEEFDRIFAVNTRGVFFCCREAARRLRGGGRIVNISTGATVGGTAGGAVYCASKAAVEQFTRALARELAWPADYREHGLAGLHGDGHVRVAAAPGGACAEAHAAGTRRQAGGGGRSCRLALHGKRRLDHGTKHSGGRRAHDGLSWRRRSTSGRGGAQESVGDQRRRAESGRIGGPQDVRAPGDAKRRGG